MTKRKSEKRRVKKEGWKEREMWEKRRKKEMKRREVAEVAYSIN